MFIKTWKITGIEADINMLLLKIVSKQTVNLPVVQSAILHEATCIYEENYAMYKLPAGREMLVTVAVGKIMESLKHIFEPEA